MNKLFLISLLFLSPSILVGQTKEEAKSFIIRTYNSYPSKYYAYGTRVRKLEISFSEDSRTLFLRNKLREISSFTGYIMCEIDLSKTIMVENNDGKIIITSLPFSNITNSVTNESKPYFVPGKGFQYTQTYWNEYYKKNGWYNDFIHLNNSQMADRVVKALKFLATENGAKLREPSF